jgi:hypothetical protein
MAAPSTKLPTFFKMWNIQFLPILATFYEVKITFWKKLVEGAAIINFLSIWYFLILSYILLGIQNQLQIFFASTFWSTSPSPWCAPKTDTVCTLWFPAGGNHFLKWIIGTTNELESLFLWFLWKRDFPLFERRKTTVPGWRRTETSLWREENSRSHDMRCPSLAKS